MKKFVIKTAATEMVLWDFGLYRIILVTMCVHCFTFSRHS
jgi:hypothetical protein